VYAKRPVLLPKIQAEVSRGLNTVRAWMQRQSLFEWVEPSGGVVCFPRLHADVDVERFYALLSQRGAVVGPGHWFERERRHMRVGFGWPLPEELEQGLQMLSECAQAARTANAK
jgi:DNA-binding transcriptional MocR family regulator